MEDKDNMLVGRRIKRFRLEAKLNQNELAEKAEIDTNNLSRIERGQTTPMLETILKIAAALEITPNDILLEIYPAPTALLDAEISNLLGDMSNEQRKKVVEYIQFLRQ